jgi:hypothetical protein
MPTIQTDPADVLDSAPTEATPDIFGQWSAAWRTVAVLAAFEISLAAALRWGLPWLTPSPGLQMGIGYVVFMALGEIWGQWLHWTTAGNRFCLRDVRRFLRAADWASIAGMVLLSATFFSWFWPWTFRLWGEHLSRPWFGVADQLFAAPLSLAPIFLLHAWLDERRTSAAAARGRRDRFRTKLCGLVQTMRVALPYWGIGLGVIFTLPFDFVFQNLLTGAIQTPFSTYLFFMANRKHAHPQTWRMRPWARWALVPIAAHNLIVFPIWCHGLTLAIGLVGYAAWLWCGFRQDER